MIMPREKRVIQKDDIIPLDIYTKKRKELRKMGEHGRERATSLFTANQQAQNSPR